LKPADKPGILAGIYEVDPYGVYQGGILPGPDFTRVDFMARRSVCKSRI